jgi:HSP20 family protein
VRTAAETPPSCNLRNIARYLSRTNLSPNGWRDAFAPKTDVYEKRDTLVIKAEMPGMKKEDVQVEILDRALVIKGKTAAEKEVKEAAYYRMERASGTYYRRLPLPFEVKPEQVTATLSVGVLEIHIPKPMTIARAATTVPVG